MKRAKFDSRDFGRTVVLTQPDGMQRKFCIPRTASGDGYVREGSNVGFQVCRGLSHGGSALTATPATLLDVIRREWRACRQPEGHSA